MKKIGGMEFYDVHFSYIDQETMEERFVSVPEQGGGKLIPEGLLVAGQQYVVTGWGQLARWAPFLASVPSPADRAMRVRQQAAILEAEDDMKSAQPEPGAQRAHDRRPDDDRPRGRSRRRRHK